MFIDDTSSYITEPNTIIPLVLLTDPGRTVVVQNAPNIPSERPELPLDGNRIWEQVNAVLQVCEGRVQTDGSRIINEIKRNSPLVLFVQKYAAAYIEQWDKPEIEVPDFSYGRIDSIVLTLVAKITVIACSMKGN